MKNNKTRKQIGGRKYKTRSVPLTFVENSGNQETQLINFSEISFKPINLEHLGKQVLETLENIQTELGNSGDITFSIVGKKQL
jgi:hypothetical protein